MSYWVIGLLVSELHFLQHRQSLNTARTARFALSSGQSPGTSFAFPRGMTPQELRDRTRAFSTRVKHFSKPLLRDFETRDVARQLRRSARGTAANYRASCVSRSPDEFVSRISVALEEADESWFWLLDLADDAIPDRAELRALTDEAHQLVKILGKSLSTARRNQARRRRNRGS